MVKERSFNKEIERTVEIGRKNQELWPRVKGWCKHLEIQLMSAGVVAEIYNLPAGTMRITCDHASAGGTASMHLENVATSFIIKNCRDCPFHQVVDIDNIGYAILEEWEKAQAESQQAQEQVVRSLGYSAYLISRRNNCLSPILKTMSLSKRPSFMVFLMVLIIPRKLQLSLLMAISERLAVTVASLTDGCDQAT